MYQSNQYTETNVMGTSNILQAISSLGKESKLKKIVLSSFRSVYGEGKYECKNCGAVYPNSRTREHMLDGNFNMYCPNCSKKLKLVKTTDDSVIRSGSLYAFTKYTQEMILHTMCPVLGVDYTIFRFLKRIWSGLITQESVYRYSLYIIIPHA